MFILNKQVESLYVHNVDKYDEELFTILFDVINKIEIRKICIDFIDLFLFDDEDRINVIAKTQSLKTQNIISNKVSCLIKLI